MLTIYNSLTRQKEVFQPLQANKIGIYVCGITVYDYCHLGHARSLVCFDVITRFLRAEGYKVNYVRNITDIDDKIIKRAQDNNETYEQLAARFIDAMHADERALNILPPDFEPRATDHIPQVIDLIERLLEKEMAYIGYNGNIYYNVEKFVDYGKLARKDLNGQEAGARVEVATAKRNPLDFVLWKPAKPGEPSWQSPWGKGRPGWHIECSAMSMHCLGETFDIHGGGYDLQFPHHENEIAQSEGATQKCFAKVWMHVGFLQINREKMSKSLGNFFTIRDVLKKYHPETIRYFLLSSQYRSQLNYSEANLNSAQAALERLYQTLKGIPFTETEVATENPTATSYELRFKAAMNDDFNTPEALSILFEIAHEINRVPEKASSLAKSLRCLGHLLGILEQSPEAFLQAGTSDAETATIEQLIIERKQARAEKNWQRADEIRQQLQAMQVELEDTASGTTWRRKA